MAFIWDGSDYQKQAGDTSGNSKIVGPAAEDAAVSGAPVQVGGRYDATPRTLDDGDVGANALDAAGRQIVAGAAAEDAAVAGNPVLSGGRYDSTPRDLDDGDAGAIALDADARVLINAGWTPSLQAEETADDSDKTFTVTASQEWEIQSIWVELVTTATAGNRQIVVEIQDDAPDVIGQFRAGAVQAASVTRYYMFSPQVGDLTSFRDTDFLSTPIPPLVLPAGYKIRVYDKAVVDAAADDMVVQMMIKSRAV